jgi:predicted RNase H-like HicB family nuclease
VTPPTATHSVQATVTPACPAWSKRLDVEPETVIYRAHEPADTQYMSVRVSGSTSYAGEYWLGGRGLLRPVRARIEASDGLLMAVEDTTGIFGAGASLADAVEDLRAALTEHYAILSASSELSDDLADQLEFLRQHLRLA